jgi:diaminopimelate decarboxylase
MAIKEPYERPIIIRHSVGLANKFGRAPSAVPLTRIDGIPTSTLLEQYGSPLYVVSESTLRRKYREMHRAFTVRYPRVQIAYSYKTNYLSSICAALHQEGAWAEVVSGFEYEIATALHVSPKNIVFNGPYKTKEELRRAVEEGAMVNIDSHEEMYLLEDIARELGRVLDVGVRVNMELGYPPWDRFGFNVESGQAFDIVKRMMSNNLLRVRGLHCHAGTYIDNIEIYRQMAEKFVELYRRLRAELTVKLEYWDIGGGFATINTLHTAYLPATQTVPSPDQYAEVIGPTLLRGPFAPNEAPLLILEPGRAVVDEAMHLATTVYAAKRLPSGAKAYVVDAGVNLMFASFWYKYEIQPAQEGNAVMEDAAVYGPLCMQIDCLRPAIPLPQLRHGDILVVKNVGAYNFSQSMQFIQPRPSIVQIADGKVHVVRERETTEYVRTPERLPQHLAPKD